MKKRVLRKSLSYGLLLIAVLAVWASLTNPFVRWSIVRVPFETKVYNQEVSLHESSEISVLNRRLFRLLAQVKSGWHIVQSRFAGGQGTKQTDIEQIISEIHQLRFDPDEPFLISGDHFSVFYPRSLGIFYHSALDSRTALNEEDWLNRQRIYLQSTAFALEVFDKAGELSTTIVPVAPRAVSLVNIYAKPSDTLYSLLYALRVMTDEEYIDEQYPFDGERRKLGTKKEAQKLLDQYRGRLEYFLERFEKENLDSKTGLIRKDVLLSSTKDITKRESAFYDNVIYWKTLKLADELGVRKIDKEKLEALRLRILEQYWYEKGGYFIEDLSEGSLRDKYYSSDWLIVYMTGFLDPQRPEDRPYLARSLEYISSTGLSRPLALPYQSESRRERQYWLVRYIANDYGSVAIWSNWGMEYVKLLGAMYKTTGKKMYLEEALYQMEEYEKRIELYRGYPEVYDSEGRFFSKLLYKSVRRTGWVVSFEQARMMVKDAGRSWLTGKR